jgi:hypothetical protein
MLRAPAPLSRLARSSWNIVLLATYTNRRNANKGAARSQFSGLGVVLFVLAALGCSVHQLRRSHRVLVLEIFSYHIHCQNKAISKSVAALWSTGFILIRKARHSKVAFLRSKRSAFKRESAP